MEIDTANITRKYILPDLPVYVTVTKENQFPELGFSKMISGTSRV